MFAKNEKIITTNVKIVYSPLKFNCHDNKIIIASNIIMVAVPNPGIEGSLFSLLLLVAIK